MGRVLFLFRLGRGSEGVRCEEGLHLLARAFACVLVHLRVSASKRVSSLFLVSLTCTQARVYLLVCISVRVSGRVCVVNYFLDHSKNSNFIFYPRLSPNSNV